ncbi:hypothetical protein B5E58_10470 [Tyzzerella sp. An114]|uniref:S-layer homology domain-containing protein n=1 Tax=Tyzzerella sp. An114 TaxID=1965545 RepID=UPI000B42E0BF|nr:S-layer homology domain-containing protein [Tyzzerella sp. An114]OUQ56640.1 hypothetical protein B5E58_10470 [Tyzzerella sp. An114]
MKKGFKKLVACSMSIAMLSAMFPVSASAFDLNTVKINSNHGNNTAIEYCFGTPETNSISYTATLNMTDSMAKLLTDWHSRELESAKFTINVDVSVTSEGTSENVITDGLKFNTDANGNIECTFSSTFLTPDPEQFGEIVPTESKDENGFTVYTYKIPVKPSEIKSLKMIVNDDMLAYINDNTITKDTKQFTSTITLSGVSADLSGGAVTALRNGDTVKVYADGTVDSIINVAFVANDVTFKFDADEVYNDFKADTHTVTFNSNGGTSVAPQTVVCGNTITRPEVTNGVRPLNNWLVVGEGTVFDFSTPITKDITLIADWGSGSGGGTGGGGGGGITIEDEEPPLADLNLEDHFAYIVGYDDGTIRPENQITRAEVAAIYYRLLTDYARTMNLSRTTNFTDVNANSWYNTSVATLTNMGIISGYPDGTFKPDAPISRAELATIASKFSELTEGTSTFTDVAGHWAEDYINFAYTYGWISGYPDNTFKPNQAITRAEVMSLTNRVLQRATHAGDMLDTMRTYTDVPTTAWYYEAVQEATNTHGYERTEEIVEGRGFCYEKWTELLPDPDWSTYN